MSWMFTGQSPLLDVIRISPGRLGGNRSQTALAALLGSALLTNRSPFDRKLEVIRSWSPGPTGVVAAAVTPDGRCVVSGAWDNTLRVRNLPMGEINEHTPGPSRHVQRGPYAVLCARPIIRRGRSETILRNDVACPTVDASLHR